MTNPRILFGDEVREALDPRSGELAITERNTAVLKCIECRTLIEPTGPTPVALLVLRDRRGTHRMTFARERCR